MALLLHNLSIYYNTSPKIYVIMWNYVLTLFCAAMTSWQRGSGCSVIDDIEFPMAILAYFFSSPY